MSTYNLKPCVFFLFFQFLLLGNYLIAKEKPLSISELAKQMVDKNVSPDSVFIPLGNLIGASKISDAVEILQQLEKSSPENNHRSLTIINLLKAKINHLVYLQYNTPLDSHIIYYEQAMNEAYLDGSNELIVMASWDFGEAAWHIGKAEYASLYCLLGAEMAEKSGIKLSPFRNALLSNVLYNAKEYQKAIGYALRSAADMENEITILGKWDLTGVCYRMLGKTDSALFYLNKAMAKANLWHNDVWKGIISAELGYTNFLLGNNEKAMPQLMYGYEQSVKSDEQAVAANALQNAARLNLVNGNKQLALQQVVEALPLFESDKKNRLMEYKQAYLQNIYEATATVYRSLGKEDSALKYHQLYTNHYDSTERRIANSRYEVAKLKLRSMENISAIKDLERAKQSAALQRNVTIAAATLLTIIFLLLVSKQKQKAKFSQQLTNQQKEAAELELKLLTGQMEVFKQRIAEKTLLIEKLENQPGTPAYDKTQILEAILNQSILTTEDWQRFKLLFEKLNPGFFNALINKSPDITPAEQRIAAMVRLRLNTKEIAALLGISDSSVRKARQRLRERLGITEELDAIIEKI